MKNRSRRQSSTKRLRHIRASTAFSQCPVHLRDGRSWGREKRLAVSVSGIGLTKHAHSGSKTLASWRHLALVEKPFRRCAAASDATWPSQVFHAFHVCVSAACLLLGAHIVPICDDTWKSFFPPPLRLLAAWSACFRCHRTFANYVGYVRTFCLALGVDVQVLLIATPRFLPLFLCIGRCSDTLWYSALGSQSALWEVFARVPSVSSDGGSQEFLVSLRSLSACQEARRSHCWSGRH